MARVRYIISFEYLVSMSILGKISKQVISKGILLLKVKAISYPGSLNVGQGRLINCPTYVKLNMY